MWVRLWVAFSVSAAICSQHTNTRVHQSGDGFEWGWQLAPGSGSDTVGHYYVKLPQAEQRVVYTADSSGYHGAVAVNTSDARHTYSSMFALGEKALQLNAHQAPQLQISTLPSSSQTSNGETPVDIYLLQQQFPSLLAPQPPQYINLLSSPDPIQLPNYYYNSLSPLYDFHTQHPRRSNGNTGLNESSKPLKQEAKTEQSFVTPVVQVFKDHNCSNEETIPENISTDLENDLKKSKKLFAEVPSYELREVNGNFGARNQKLLQYHGEANYKVENPRPNARTERFYSTTESATHNATEDGINRLVASTQDLITNEDLLNINHAIEHHLRDSSDDLIKPRPRFSVVYRNNDNHEKLQASPSTFTVRAKIGNILQGEIEHLENNAQKDKILQNNANEYRFASPIVVADNTNQDYNEQLVNNVVSTMIPYLENGYQIVGIRNGLEKSQDNGSSEDPNKSDNRESNEDLINVTPRPIGSNYLAPITVALRLLNSNDNDTFNFIEDHEASDSELVTDTVDKPYNDKTTVDIQQSIPLEETHINDVEVHEYLDEGRSNNKEAFEIAKNLYEKYMDALRSSRKIQENMNKMLYKYGSMSQENSDENDSDNESTEQLDTSENVHSQVEINPNGENGNNQRSEVINFYSENEYGNGNQRIIQPIVIEKEVPVTKFVNRYIEKKVPYTETVTVPVPVDRPVPYPVQVEKVVEKPVQVTQYVDKPYPIEVPRPYPVEVQVPYPVEQKVYVDRPVHVPYPIEKVVEKQIHIPVPTPVGVPIEVPVPYERQVLYPVPVDRPVQVTVDRPVERIKEVPVPVPVTVEKRVPYPVPYETKVPVPYPVERRIPVPVDRIVEKPVTVTQVIEKPVHIQVPVPQPVPVHVHHPYPVDRIVEKKVPYPVPYDRIVEKRVPYPVEKIVEKVVEKPVVVTKYINKPYPVTKLVPYPVEKIVEKKVPYEVQVPVQTSYHSDKPNKIKVAYRYGYRADESRNNLQYEHPNQDHEKIHNIKSQYEEYLKDYQNKYRQPVQSTLWGNQYASSFQYINTTDRKNEDVKRNQALVNYLGYLTNTPIKNLQEQYSQNQYNPFSQGHQQSAYYGPVPNQNQYGDQNSGHNLYYQNQDSNQDSSQTHNNWNNNQNYFVELKVRRTDRVPKVNIEYGFKPPLIPSTEIDLDGMPINKQD